MIVKAIMPQRHSVPGGMVAVIWIYLDSFPSIAAISLDRRKHMRHNAVHSGWESNGHDRTHRCPERRRQTREKGYTTKEVFEHLKSLTSDEPMRDYLQKKIDLLAERDRCDIP